MFRRKRLFLIGKNIVGFLEEVIFELSYKGWVGLYFRVGEGIYGGRVLEIELEMYGGRWFCVFLGRRVGGEFN